MYYSYDLDFCCCVRFRTHACLQACGFLCVLFKLFVRLIWEFLSEGSVDRWLLTHCCAAFLNNKHTHQSSFSRSIYFFLNDFVFCYFYRRRLSSAAHRPQHFFFFGFLGLHLSTFFFFNFFFLGHGQGGQKTCGFGGGGQATSSRGSSSTGTERRRLRERAHVRWSIIRRTWQFTRLHSHNRRTLHWSTTRSIRQQLRVLCHHIVGDNSPITRTTIYHGQACSMPNSHLTVLCAWTRLLTCHATLTFHVWCHPLDSANFYLLNTRQILTYRLA